MRVGDPLSDETQMGPLISADQRETVGSFVTEDDVAFRGSAPEGDGFWFPPTVLAPMTNDDRASREEIFGPVACVIPFDDEAEAIRLANDTIYGLSGSIWTRDGARALRVARAIDTGVLSINSHSSVRVSTPFGGFKQSGVGRELGPDALDAYTDVKNVFYATDEAGDGAARRQGLRDHRRRERDRRRVGAALQARRARAWSGWTSAPTRRAISRSSATSPTRTRWRRMYARVRDEMGGIDVLFNNAGINPNADTTVTETTLEAWQLVQDVNVRSVFLCCKHGIPHLLERGGGSVINTASFVAVMGAAVSQISYTASKGAVLSLSRELGVEFGARGVRVNALCPGPVNTPLLRELFAKDPERAAKRLVHVPMGRFGEAEEIANAALFLASDESSFVTATTFMADGGLSGAYLTPGQV